MVQANARSLRWASLSLFPEQQRERSGSQLLPEFYFIHVSPEELGKAGVDDVSSAPCVASAAPGEKVEADQPLAGVAPAAENVNRTASGYGNTSRRHHILAERVWAHGLMALSFISSFVKWGSKMSPRWCEDHDVMSVGPLAVNCGSRDITAI